MPIYKTEKKKDGKQGYRVVVNYTTPSGEYKQKVRLAYGLPEAKMLEASLLSAVGEDNHSTRMTVAELVADYLANHKYDVRRTTIAKSESVLRNNVLCFISDERIDKLTPKKLQAWKNQVSERGVSLVTRQHAYREFSAVLNYAVKMEYIKDNPLHRVGNFKDVYITPKNSKIRYYTSEQFKAFIKAAKSFDRTKIELGSYVFFNIAYFTGMRKGEINALRWSDIEDNIIHVRRSISQKIKGMDIDETPPKNLSSYRDLQIPSTLADILAEHREKQRADAGYSDEWRVCGGPCVIADTTLDKFNRKCAELAELPRITIHEFRHSHASLLANEGINIQEIARRLGHSKIETTWNTYSHLYPREEERAVKILENI